MENEKNRYSKYEAEEKAAKIKKVVGESGSSQDYRTAEEMVEEELKMTPEGEKALSLFQEAHSAQSEEEKIDKALEFCRLLSKMVDPRSENDEQAVKEASIQWHKGRAGEAEDIVFNAGKLSAVKFHVGSGTSGCRIFFDDNPSKEQPGYWMNYYKPDVGLGAREEGERYWDNYMKHFKRPDVKLK